MDQEARLAHYPPRLSDAEFWEMNERHATQRIRDDARRPLGENLASALALSALAMELRDGLRRTLARKSA